MDEYEIVLERVDTLRIKVRASSYEEALERAYEEAPNGLCIFCSGTNETYSIDAGEWDEVEVPADE